MSGLILELKELGPGISRHHKGSLVPLFNSQIVITLAADEHSSLPTVNARSNVRRWELIYPFTPCREHAALGLLLLPCKPLRCLGLHLLAHPLLPHSYLIVQCFGFPFVPLPLHYVPNLSLISTHSLYSCSIFHVLVHRVSSISGTVLAGLISAPL